MAMKGGRREAAELTMRWKRSCFSGNYRRLQSRNQTPHTGSRLWGGMLPAHRSLPRLPLLCPPSPTSTSRRSWTRCICAPSSTSSPWMSSCIHPSPTSLSLPMTSIRTYYYVINISSTCTIIITYEHWKIWITKIGMDGCTYVPFWKPSPSWSVVVAG